MEFENLLNEIEQVIVKNNSLNNDTSINNNKESLKQVLYINLNYLEHIYHNNYNNLLQKSNNTFELYRSLFLQCNHTGKSKIQYILSPGNNNFNTDNYEYNLNGYYGLINKYNCRKCNNFIHLKQSYRPKNTIDPHSFINTENKKKIYVFGWCRFNFNNNSALCPNCKKPHMNELLQQSSYIFINQGTNPEYLNRNYKCFQITKINKTKDDVNDASGTGILKNNACFTIKLKDDKYFHEYKNWIIETNNNNYYDNKVKNSLKNENLIKQIIDTNNTEEYFENITDDNNNDNNDNNNNNNINNIFNENICSYIGSEFVETILNLSVALNINLKKEYNKYYIYLFNYYHVNYDLNNNLMMLNDLYKNLIIIKQWRIHCEQNLHSDDNYNLFEYYPSKKLQYTNCIYCKKSYWFIFGDVYRLQSFTIANFDKNKNMEPEMTLLKNKNYNCVCEECSKLH